MSEDLSFKVNRAPVLTLWAAIVAERLGFDHDEALTLGRAVAGLNAYAKGKRLGIYKPSSDSVSKKREERSAEGFEVDLLHRAIHAVATPEGIRATAKGKPTRPASVEKYLTSKFGDNLQATEKAMAVLAKSLPPDELSEIAYQLYERFRPEIPRGVEGWGATGILSLAKIASAGQKLKGPV
ncbi:MAG: hypothetical protein KDK75_13070 [Alphaproteobacteria bacterium]|nr:hypothetical protein [Alphaproteobacteria bacterium]